MMDLHGAAMKLVRVTITQTPTFLLVTLLLLSPICSFPYLDSTNIIAVSTATQELLPKLDINGYRDENFLPFQILAGIGSYVGCISYFDRPRGDISPLCGKKLEKKTSNISNAGLGLFVTSKIPKDTIIGTYPGVVRPLERYVKEKLQHYPQSAQYIWRFSDNRMVIDPTDPIGQLHDFCIGGTSDWFGSYFLFQTLFREVFKKDTMLARINEPPPMSDCNIYVVEDVKQRKVTFLTSRDIFSGEELFLDYGKTYDRTMYAKSNDI